MPDNSNNKYTVDDLLYMMSRLRDPETGCPWDLKQSFDTIVPYTLEEAYEVADAIQKKDFPHLKEELGDLLFQVIFYAQMGKEQSHFEFGDIVHTLVTKLVRRHPHVFPSGELHSENNDQVLTDEQIKQKWEEIKAQERAEKEASDASNNQAINSILSDIPDALPALQRAEKLQKRAATVGFDWPEASQVLDKIEEEIAELRVAMANDDQAEIQDELGDLMFAMTNLARHVNVKSEMAIRSTNQKFVKRFQFIESRLSEQSKSLEDATLEEMEALWQLAKSAT